MVHKYEPIYYGPARPHGHEEYYKLSLDEYDEESNTYLNLLPQRYHQAYGVGDNLSDGFSTAIWQTFTNRGASCVGAELGVVNYKDLYPFSIAYREMRGQYYFFVYERQAKELPAPTTGEIVIDDKRYYYQTAQSVTLTYPAYIGTNGISFQSVTETFTCKAGWYYLTGPIVFPTDKVGYVPNYDYGVQEEYFKSASYNTYTNGNNQWIYTRGQWLRYQTGEPLTQALTSTEILKYVNKGGHRGYYPGTVYPNFDLVTIEEYNAENLLFQFGPGDINLGDNSITVSAEVGRGLRSGMLLSFVPSNDNFESIFPTVKENKRLNPSTSSWPFASKQALYSYLKNPNSPDDRPAYLGFKNEIKLVYIEKISDTKIRLWPNYSDRVTFGVNQKPGDVYRTYNTFYEGFYEQPYFDNQQNTYANFFLTAGSGYTIFVYRFIEDYPDGTALLPFEIEGAYPHYEMLKSSSDTGAMFWSWLDSRYVSLSNSKIKMSLNTLPNYDRLAKNYTTGTRITVRLAKQIQPRASAAKAIYAFTENVPSLSGEITVQGIKLVQGLYVLLLGQADTKKNHLYYVNKKAWEIITPSSDTYTQGSTLDVPEYYNEYAMVQVTNSFENNEKTTIYRAKFTYSSISKKEYTTAWERTDIDCSMEIQNFDRYRNYEGYSFSYSGYVTGETFALKGWSSLPKPLIENGIYYLIKDGEYISFAASYEDAINNKPIILENTGKGIMVINTPPKTGSAYLEKVVSQNPEVTEPINDTAVYLINKGKGRFQLADSKENALAKIPMKLKIRPNDYFALAKATKDSLPAASIFTFDQKYFSWDVDNPNKKLFQRPVPKYRDIDACDLAAVLSSSASINLGQIALTEFETTLPLVPDSPYFNNYYYGYGYYYNYGYYGYYGAYGLSPYNAYGSGYYFTNYYYAYNPYNYYGNYYNYYYNSLDTLFFLNGQTRRVAVRNYVVQYRPYKYLEGFISPITYESFNDYEEMEYTFPPPPPSKITITQLGLSSSSSYTIAEITKAEHQPYYTFTQVKEDNSFFKTYYRKYESTNIQSIIDAIAEDLFGTLNPSSIKFYKFTSNKSEAYIDAFGKTSETEVASNLDISSGLSYYSSGSVSKTYDTVIEGHDATLIPEEWETIVNINDPNYNGLVLDYRLKSQATITYQARPIFKSTISASISYTAAIYSGTNNDLFTGVDVGVPGRHNDVDFPGYKTYSTAKITATLNVSPSTHGISRNSLNKSYFVTGDYTFDGTTFTKKASTAPYSNLLPSTFTVSVEEYYFPRTSLKLDLTSTVKHIWKKACFTTVDPPRYSYSPRTLMTTFLETKNIKSSDYDESVSDISGPITLVWNASQKRYQSQALSSKNVRFRCEALVGHIRKDKQIRLINSQNYYPYTSPIYISQESSPTSEDYYTISLFGSPNTWFEFTGIRKILPEVTTTAVKDSYSMTVSKTKINSLALSQYVSADNSKTVQLYFTTYQGYYSWDSNSIFKQFHGNSTFSPVQFVNNGYELAIADVSLNRHPCWDTRFDLDIENRYNGTANFPVSLSSGTGNTVTNSLNQKGYIRGIFAPGVTKNGMLPFNPYTPYQSINIMSPPTAITVVSATGTGGAVSLSTFKIETTVGSYYQFSSGYNYIIEAAGKNYVSNVDYVMFNVTPAVLTYDPYTNALKTITAGTPVVYYALIGADTSVYSMTHSAIYPYSSKGIDGETEVPHIAAPVTIGLIKKISFE